MMPIHGKFVPYNEFSEAALTLHSMTTGTSKTN